jgi:hypothetical protein
LAAYKAIKSTAPDDADAFPPEFDERGGVRFVVDHKTLDRLTALRGAGESYSDVILRLAKGWHRQLEASMTYYLRYKYDRKEGERVLTLPYSTEPDAVIAACAVIAEGTGWDLEIINHDNEIVANDLEIRNRCKQSRTP